MSDERGLVMMRHSITQMEFYVKQSGCPFVSAELALALEVEGYLKCGASFHGLPDGFNLLR